MTTQQVIDLARGFRAYYVEHGHDKKTCAIGWFENTVKLASDKGAIDFTIQPNGRVSRMHMGSPSVLVEWVGDDVTHTIQKHIESAYGE